VCPLCDLDRIREGIAAPAPDPLAERVNALEASLKAAGIPLCERATR